MSVDVAVLHGLPMVTNNIVSVGNRSPALTISKVLLSISSLLTDPNPGMIQCDSLPSVPLTQQSCVCVTQLIHWWMRLHKN